MREDRSTPPYLNRTLLLVVPATLVSLVILASFWAATFQPPNPDKQFEGDKEDKEDKVKSVDKNQLKVEIIIPHKSWPPPLKEHDLLYDSPAPESLVRHHSGHYRRKLADIWDPHPQYEFKAFGKTFHLQLQLGPSFTTPDLQVTQVWRNMSIKESPRVKPNGCFYSGKVLGDSASSVAVNLCHGITGHIRTCDGSYLIEPAEPYRDHDTPIKHSLIRLSSSSSAQCSTSHINLQDKVETELHQVIGSDDERTRRRKRSLSQEYFIELMVVADNKMVDYHGSELHPYILTLMSIVTQIFKDASIGNPISIAVVKLYELRDVDLDDNKQTGRWWSGSSSHKTVSASDILKRFCVWQHRVNDENDASPNHHDSAILLTRENICRDPKTDKCDTLGLAELGTMCDKLSSCSLVKDNGLSAAFTIAHELGHVLNLPHDDDQRCNSLGNSVEVNNVMSRMLDHNTYPWAWSNCSRHLLTEYLDAGYGSCLLDTPIRDLQKGKTLSLLPGEHFNEDRQCQLVYGPDSKICSYMPVCKRLWCTLKDEDKEYCQTQHMPWADGTSCGEGYWCQRGDCVPRDRNALRPVHGGWGPWGVFSACSRTCGGGVQQAERSCNNPRPSNGGRYCVGRRIKYRSCSTKQCPNNNDFRAEQCAKFNNNSLKIQGLTNEVKWVPKYGGIVREDRCKLYCRVHQSSAYYLLSEKVIDGTPCGPDTFDICVNGVCNPAGCDHKLNSSLQLDYCGECGGNNSSCQQVSGSYDLSQYGYSTVVRIPSGSSNLDIRQIGYMGTNKDDNYLALADDNDSYILNGNHFVSMFRKLILYGGTTLEYTGSDAIIERINSSRPLQRDLIVKVLSVGNLYAPNIVYEYTIQKSTLAQYTWELSKDWRYCDKVCNGESEKEAICVRVADGEKVDLFFCKELPKPVSPKKPCNKHCTLLWEITSRSECSSHCGPGTRSLSFQCVQSVHKPSLRRVAIDNSSCHHLTPPSVTEPCTGPCDEARWMFTPWSSCSKTCGEGIQTRNASCVDELNRPRDESDCRLGEKKIERICNLEKCPQWGFGEWSPCSVTCGEGHRRRGYWCHVDNLKVGTDKCQHLPVPHHLAIDTCYLDPCPHWIAKEWSKCSVSCGEGVEERIVECSVKDKCSLESKPISVQPCSNVVPCKLTHINALPDSSTAFRKLTWRPKPYGPCSVSCGEGMRWREVECYDEKYNKIRPKHDCQSHLSQPETMEKCSAPRCPMWKIGQWGKCSAHCNEGIESREVICVNHNNEEIDDNYCTRPRPESERICYANERCQTPIWTTSPWSQCSASCGKGYRTRIVKCESETRHCPQPVPATQEPCNVEPCAKASWSLGNWSQCSKTCGDGWRLRYVRCKSSDGEDLPDEACGGRANGPTHATPCHIPCNKYLMYDWQYSRHWSPCSKTCGKGVRMRKVWCAKSSGVRVPDSECNSRNKPKSVKECQRAACAFSWVPRPWSQCSVSCGRGWKTRGVQCFGYKGYNTGAPSLVDSSYCSNITKPTVRSECIMQPCTYNNKHSNYRWVPGPWLECSEKCSRRGQQKRKLFCYLGNTKVKRPNCPKATRPKRRQKCTADGCKSCLEVQRNLNHKKDGEYKLEVNDKIVHIYCSAMNTSKPREYLTLHAARENYAEIYDMSLKKSDTCPSGGMRLDFCQDCIRNNKHNMGFTFFKKIRINTTTLLVDGRDWTFAVVVRGGRVAYGEAGDCYSKANCPQGQFRINLERTGFKVSRHQQWVKTGDYAHNSVQKYEDGIKVVGVCGGYCGICRPHRGLKLDVLPP